MTDVAIRTEDWTRLPWKNYQRNVFHLQQRILRQAQDRSTEPRDEATGSVSMLSNGYCFAHGQPAD
jgi:hypothetical protein